MRPSRPATRPPRARGKCSGASRGRLWAPEAAESGYKSAAEGYPKVWPAAARTGGGNCPPLAPAQNPAEPPGCPEAPGALRQGAGPGTCGRFGAVVGTGSLSQSPGRGRKAATVAVGGKKEKCRMVKKSRFWAGGKGVGGEQEAV